MNADSNTIDMFGCKYREGSFTGTFGKRKVPLSVYDILSLGLLTKLTVPDKFPPVEWTSNTNKRFQVLVIVLLIKEIP